MPDMYRVGIIGCGGISRAHSNAYKAVARTEIVAAADISEQQLQKYSQEYGVKALYTNYIEMLEKEKLDIVSICTYPIIRRDITVNTAQRGVKGIYCEKPMCMSLQEADDMVEACEKAGVQLIVGHQRRFEAQYVKAKEILDSGAIGELYKMETCCPGWDVFEWGTHWIDIMRFYNNDVEAECVFAQIDRRWDRTGYGHRMETECISYIKFKNGVRGFFESGDHALPGFFNHIIGTEGIIELNLPNRPALRARVLGEKDWIVPELKGGNPFNLTVEALIESIETGKPHPLNGRSARAGQEIIMATYESALTGKLISLPLKRKESPLGVMLDRVGIPLVL